MAYQIIEGLIATHNKEPFLGQIVVNEDRLIESVHQGTPHHATIKYDDNCYIFAAFIEAHCHGRESPSGKHNYKENYMTLLNAMINGGIAASMPMPNQDIPCINEEQFFWHLNRIQSLMRPGTILPYLGIEGDSHSKGKVGEFAYKLYFGKSVGDLTITEQQVLDRTLRNYINEFVSFHVEDQDVIDACIDGKDHTQRRPEECVVYGLAKVIDVIEKYSLRAKLCHWSTGGKSFEMIAEHRARQIKKGLYRTQLEVSPLHLIFNYQMTLKNPELWLKIQMNPAVQSEFHQNQLIAGLKSGFIDMLATDHAPHTREEKLSAFAKFRDQDQRFKHMTNIQIANFIKESDKNLFEKTCCENGHSGAPWIDDYSRVCTWLMDTHGFTPQRIAQIASANPGGFLNNFLSHLPNEKGKGYGKIEPGYNASFTILNMNKPQIASDDKVKTNVGWTPLHGMKFPGGLEDIIIFGDVETNNFH